MVVPAPGGWQVESIECFGLANDSIWRFSGMQHAGGALDTERKTPLSS